MYLVVIIFVILNAFIASALGDMLMESKTYKIRATATNSEGKLVNVSGTLMDFKLLSLTPEGEINNDDYTFSIVAKEIDNSVADSDYELNAFPILNLPTAGSNELSPMSGKDFEQQKNVPIHSSSFNSLPVGNSLYKSNDAANIQLNRANNNFDNVPASSRQNPPSTQPSGPPLLPLFRNISATQMPSEKIEDKLTTPSNKSGQPAESLLNSSTWPAGGELPQTSQLNVAQSYPIPLSDDFNDGSTKTQMPSQTFNTEPLQDARKGHVKTPQFGSHRNVFDQKNSETYQEHGPHVDDMPSFSLDDSFEGVEPGRLSKVGNVSLTPINNVTSIDLAPIRGKPWINQTSKNDGTQIYANTPEINMLLPLQNISVSDSSSEHDSSTAKYASLDPESFLQELEPVNETTINRMVDDYFNSERNDSMTVDDALNMSLMEEIINEVEDMFNDQPEIFTVPEIENTSPRVIPTELDVVEIVEVITNDDQGTTVTEKTIWPEATYGENSTAATPHNNLTTGSNNGSIVNVSTAGPSMESLPGTAKGNTVAPSGLAVLLITVSIVIHSVICQ